MTTFAFLCVRSAEQKQSKAKQSEAKTTHSYIVTSSHSHIAIARSRSASKCRVLLSDVMNEQSDDRQRGKHSNAQRHRAADHHHQHHHSDLHHYEHHKLPVRVGVGVGVSLVARPALSALCDFVAAACHRYQRRRRHRCGIRAALRLPPHLIWPSFLAAHTFNLQMSFA